VVTADGYPTTDPAIPGDVALEQGFDGGSLFALRSAVAAHGSELGLNPQRVADLVLVVQELAANTVRHASAAGTLRLWLADGRVVCQVADGGPGLADPDAAGMQRAATGASAGRGLWIVRQLADSVEISSEPTGLTVTVTFTLD
jgi:anti-sigma regulatory factor (Ser/Thr protein kinase)